MLLEYCHRTENIDRGTTGRTRSEDRTSDRLFVEFFASCRFSFRNCLSSSELLTIRGVGLDIIFVSDFGMVKPPSKVGVDDPVGKALYQLGKKNPPSPNKGGSLLNESGAFLDTTGNSACWERSPVTPAVPILVAPGISEKPAESVERNRPASRPKVKPKLLKKRWADMRTDDSTTEVEDDYAPTPKLFGSKSVGGLSDCDSSVGRREDYGQKPRKEVGFATEDDHVEGAEEVQFGGTNSIDSLVVVTTPAQAKATTPVTIDPAAKFALSALSAEKEMFGGGGGFPAGTGPEAPPLSASRQRGHSLDGEVDAVSPQTVLGGEDAGLANAPQLPEGASRGEALHTVVKTVIGRDTKLQLRFSEGATAASKTGGMSEKERRRRLKLEAEKKQQRAAQFRQQQEE